MRYKIRHILAILVLLVSSRIHATQIEFRNREIEPKATDYNFKVGNLALDLRYALGVIYDDNSNRSSTRRTREEGTKIGNALTLNVDWPLNPHIHIQTGVKLGYEFFIGGEGTDGFIVSGSEGDVAGTVSLDLKLGQNGLLTLKEQLERSLDTVEIDRIDNAENFSLWQNMLSLQYQNQLSQFTYLATEAAWRETWSAESDFDFRDNSAFSIDSVLLSQLNSFIQAGPYVRFVRSLFHNRDNFQFRHNDTDDFEIGLNFRYQISSAMLAILSIGYQEFTVDEEVSGLPPSLREDPQTLDDLNDEDDGVALEFKLYDELSDFITHRLIVSYRRNVGTSPTINFSEDILTNYSIKWEFVQNWEILGQFTWLKTNESSRAGEIADLFITLGGLRYHISPKSNVSFDYRRSEKFSSESGRNYERNEIRFLFGYDF